MALETVNKVSGAKSLLEKYPEFDQESGGNVETLSMLSIRVHLILMVILEFLGFAAGGVVVGYFWFAGQFGNNQILAGLALFAGVTAGTCIPRIIFRLLLPARCEKEGCGGRAFPREKSPVTYVCARCGTRAATAMSETHELHEPREREAK